MRIILWLVSYFPLYVCGYFLVISCVVLQKKNQLYNLFESEENRISTYLIPFYHFTQTYLPSIEAKTFVKCLGIVLMNAVQTIVAST